MLESFAFYLDYIGKEAAKSFIMMQLQNLLELNTQVLVWMLCVVSMIVFAAPQLVTTCTEDADFNES